jgi:acetoin utilization deacetylase AcuC-like enzyme
MAQIVFDPVFLEHGTGVHPESAERLIACKRLLEEKGEFRPLKPEQVSEKQLLLVHSKSLVGEIRERSLEGRGTPDNVFNNNTFEIAKLACGSALRAARASEKEFAFSLARPPGHHAGRAFFGGFCYFNNVAFAVREMQRSKGFGRAMIVDFDLHHGNGTQDIFYNDKSVFYLSLHQDPVFTFPGTGFKRENNGHIKSVPLDPGTTDKKYLEIFSCEFNDCFRQFRPEIIGISAGFDIFASDFMVGSRLAIRKHETFLGIAQAIGKAAEKEGTPCFGTLEGGYDPNDLPLNLLNFLNGFK